MAALAAAIAASACSMPLFWLTCAVLTLDFLDCDFGPGGIQIRDRVVVVLLGHGPPLGQRLQAPLVRFGLAEAREGHVEIGLGALDQGVVLGERQIRLGLGELRLGLQELRLVLALVEREEELVLLHHGALGEVLRLEERRHPGADLHRFLGVGLRDELAVDRHRLLDDFRDHHVRGRRGGRGLLLLGFLAPIAGSQRDGQPHDTERRHDLGPRSAIQEPSEHGHLTLLLGHFP